MQIVIYVLIALFATVIGSVSGMGGGAIMKPLFDLLQQYSAADISILTACTVFMMALVSVIISRKTLKENAVDGRVIALLAVGSVAGGYLGQLIFKTLTASSTDAVVKIVQNAALICIVIGILASMLKKGEQKQLNCKSPVAAAFVGLALGIIASFLGIGGGPINVVIFMFVFGYGMKSAALCSLITIVFSQAAKLITVLAESGTQAFNLLPLPFVVLAGVVGALIGRFISKKLTEQQVKYCYAAAQMLIVCLCVYNIVRYSLAI